MLIGKFKFNISILQPLEKIANDQQEYHRKNEQENFKKAITERHISLGNGLINVGKFEEAKAEFLSALSVDPVNSEASMGLFKSQILIVPDGTDANIEVMEKKVNMIFKFNENDPHAYYLLGMVHKEGDHRAAMHNFKKALHLDSKLADAYYRIGMLYEINDQMITSEAFEYYLLAYELSPLNETYLNNLAYQYLQSGQFVLAINKYTELIGLNQNDLLPYITISHAYLRTNDFAQSAKYINDCIQIAERRPAIMESKLNRMRWYFEEFDKNKVLIHTVSQKLCYAYFLGFYKNMLIGNDVRAISFLQKGMEMFRRNEFECEQIKRLIEFEISNYVWPTSAAPEIKEKVLNEFSGSLAL